MKKGWYLHCPECSRDLFASRWKWLANSILRYIHRMPDGVYGHSIKTITLVWRSGK